MNSRPSFISCSFVVRPAARSASNLSASRKAASVAGRHRAFAVRRRFADCFFAVRTLAIVSPFAAKATLLPKKMCVLYHISASLCGTKRISVNFAEIENQLGVHTTLSIQPQSSPSETLPSLEYVHSMVCEPAPVIARE